MKKTSLIALCIALITVLSLGSCTKDAEKPEKPTKAAAIEIVDRYTNDENDKGSYSTAMNMVLSSGTSTTEIKSTGSLQYEQKDDDLVFYKHTSTTKKDSVSVTSDTTYYEGVFYYSDGKDMKIKSTADKKAVKETFSFGPELPDSSADFNTIKFGSKDEGYILTMNDLKVDALIKTEKYLEKSLGYLNGMVDKVTGATIVAKFDKDFKLTSTRFTIKCESESGIAATLSIEMTDFSDECEPAKPENDHEYTSVEAAHYYYMIENSLASLPYANNFKAESTMTTVIKGCSYPYEFEYKMSVDNNADALTVEQTILRGNNKGTVYSYADGLLTVKNNQGTASKKFSAAEAKSFAIYCVSPASTVKMTDIDQVSVTEDKGGKVIKIVPSEKVGCDLLNDISESTGSGHSTILSLKENYVEVTLSGEEIVGVKYRFTTDDGCVIEYVLSYTYLEATNSTI